MTINGILTVALIVVLALIGTVTVVNKMLELGEKTAKKTDIKSSDQNENK